tara:strand:- start:156 stop:731 length:576 start_codon:yes stop_codon:yes gene_type:complete
MQQAKFNILSMDCDYARTAESLRNLVKMYLKYIDAVDLKNINFSQIHANIFYTLDPLLRKDKTVDIVNIDDHHDIVGYCPTMNNAYNSANWLGYYLNKPNFVESAYWLANYTSKHEPVYTDDTIHVTHDIEDVMFNKFDYIFVCSSPNYCNIYGKICYDILIEITTNKKNCDKFNFIKPNILNHQARDIIL